MIIYIPTYKRTSEQLTYKGLPEDWKDRAVLVCPKEDENALKFYNKNAHIIVQPDGLATIAAKRAWIIANCVDDKMVMMDDDLVFAMRKPGKEDDGKLVRCERNCKRLSGFLGELDDYLDNYAHAAISPRQGNNRMENGWHETKRAIYAWGFNTKIAQEELQLGRIQCREDMDYTLQLLRKGYNNIVGYECAVDQKKFDAPGGCKEERSMELSNEEAEKLAKLHEGYVKVVEKDYKSSVPRKEVIVQWKRAYNDALEGLTNAPV